MDSMIVANKGNNFPIQKTAEIKREVSEEMQTNRSHVETETVSVRKNEQSQVQEMEELQKAIDIIQGPKKTFEISVHEKTNAIMIKVLNKETGELIREVPQEKLLDLAARMMEITGIIIDKKI